MQKFFSPAEVASLLRVDPKDVLVLVEEGHLRAYRIGNFLRVGDSDLDTYLEVCLYQSRAAKNRGANASSRSCADSRTSRNACRICPTSAGRKTFRVSGSVATGAEIWPGQMRSPVRFPKEKFEALLKHFRGREIKIGAIFSGPEPGSLGAWIQENLPTKLNPASYVGGLLIDEGYAERTRPGIIRFFSERPGDRGAGIAADDETLRSDERRNHAG
jgi:excisionase family DNA binding protein